MSCTPHHLLIERGVNARELGHSIMEGIKMAHDHDKGVWPGDASDCAICLRVVNAKLLAALIQCIDNPITGYERQLARDAIEEAKK